MSKHKIESSLLTESVHLAASNEEQHIMDSSIDNASDDIHTNTTEGLFRSSAPLMIGFKILIDFFRNYKELVPMKLMPRRAIFYNF